MHAPQGNHRAQHPQVATYRLRTFLILNTDIVATKDTPDTPRLNQIRYVFVMYVLVGFVLVWFLPIRHILDGHVFVGYVLVQYIHVQYFLWYVLTNQLVNTNLEISMAPPFQYNNSKSY